MPSPAQFAAQMDLTFPRWGLILPRIVLRIPPPTSVPYSAFTHLFWGRIYIKLPHWQAHPKTPHFLAWTWKRAKCTTVWVIQTFTGQNVLKVGKTFLKVGRKSFFTPHSNTSQTFPLLTNRTPRMKLWKCSISLFALTCFYELSNQAIINFTCLLFGCFGIPIIHAIYQGHFQHWKVVQSELASHFNLYTCDLTH